MIPAVNWENLTTVLSIIHLGGKIINKSRRVITIIEGNDRKKKIEVSKVTSEALFLVLGSTTQVVLCFIIQWYVHGYTFLCISHYKRSKRIVKCWKAKNPKEINYLKHNNNNGESYWVPFIWQELCYVLRTQYSRLTQSDSLKVWERSNK